MPPTTTLLTIPSKPTAPISHTFIPASFSGYPSVLIIFINGLGLPAAAWATAISLLRAATSTPDILTYDRYGQGETTARDPLDGTQGKENGHDFLDVVTDLHEIVLTVLSAELGLTDKDLESGEIGLLLVGASIGGPIARLYAEMHPGVVKGMVILDSNICNVNYSDIMPDPSAPNFDPATVTASDCTLEQYTAARTALVKMFDLNVKNAEGLDRSTGPKLLPLADGPVLKGLSLSVVGHDPVTFAEGSFEKMGTPKSMTEKFVNAYWANYNEDLTKIAEDDKCDGVVIAKGCGHFIQTDDPSFVAKEVMKILSKLGYLGNTQVRLGGLSFK